MVNPLKNSSDFPCRKGKECRLFGGKIQGNRTYMHVGASEAWVKASCIHSGYCNQHEPYNPDEELEL